MRTGHAGRTRKSARRPRLTLTVVAVAIALGSSACDWPMFRHDVARSGFSFDAAATNPGHLSTLFTVPTNGTVFSSTAVANGIAYAGSSDGNLYAFDAGGVTGCGGSPRTCAPLWTANTASGTGFLSSPVVADGIVSIAGEDGFVYAFDAAGATNCAGTPKVCRPLWADQTPTFLESSPVVANGVLYVGSSHDTVEAFDATGVTNCSGTPKVCTPLWQGTTPGTIGAQVSSPSVANGLVYVGARDGNLYAFDAAGLRGCGGTPRVCAPVWFGITTLGADMQSSPAVSGDVVYVGSGDGKLYAFDANGNTNCASGTPRLCSPLWTGATGGGIDSSPAVGNGFVYVGSSDGKLYAFDAAGTQGCAGSPVVCSPVWSVQAGSTIDLSSPAVTTGVVYIGAFHDVDAFDAGTGAPLSHVTTGGFVEASPAIANGMIYVGSGDGREYVFAQS